MIYFLIAVPILSLLLKPSYGLKIKGRENLKLLKNQGFLTISNHVQILDCVMVALAVKKRKVTFTSMSSNFDIPVAGHLVKALGVIPTPGNVYQTELFLKNCKKFVENKRILHIYPEGHLVPYYNGLRPFNKGAFKIAVKNNAPILPIVFSWRKRKGLYRLWLPEKPCINLTIGKPIYPNLDLPKKEQDEYMKNEAFEAMKNIYDENNTLIIKKNNKIERMSKFEAQTLLINLCSELPKEILDKFNHKLLAKAQSGNIRKEKIIDLIIELNDYKENSHQL